MTTTVNAIDPRAVGIQLEAKLAAWNIEYRYVPEMPIDEIEVQNFAQVRDVNHIAPKDTVEEYAAQMRGGAVFPPVILLGNTLLLDGNTRIAAARKNRRKTIPAFQCDFPNGDLGRAFAAACNQMGGKRLSRQEAHRQAQTLFGFGYEDDSISRELGYSRSQINNWRRETNAREKAETTLVVDRFDTLPKDHQRKLAGIVHHAPFAAAVDLLADVKPKAKEVTELVAQIAKAPSDADALAVVEQAKQDLRKVGPDPGRTVVSPELRTAQRHIGGLATLSGSAMLLIETRADRREKWIADWTAVRDLANEVLAAHG